MSSPWPAPSPNPGNPRVDEAAVFPAAAPAGDWHPPACPCPACMEELLARLARPLVDPGPLTDKALAGRR